MTKKRILIVGPTYPYRGGNSLFVSYLYDALIKEFDVEIVNFKLMYPSILFPGTTQYDESNEHFMKVPSKRMVNSIGPLSWWRTAKYIKKQNPDLVVFDWWQPFFGPCYRAISTLIDRQFENRILFLTENVISHEHRAVDRILTKIGLKHADRFLALSKQVVEDLKPFNPGNKKVFRSELPVFGWFKKDDAIDKNSLKKAFGYQPEDTVLLFFGYVRHYKGLDILIDAFAELNKKNPSYKLLVAGEFYDSPSIYTDQIKKLGLEDQINLENQFIPNEEVAKYFQAADALVMPYRSATQSGILNIAYGYELPVVVTRVGGLEEFVDQEQTGVIVDKADKEHLVAGVERFFELRDSVDFESFIRNRVQGSSFLKIAGVFEEIVAESLKTS